MAGTKINDYEISCEFDHGQYWTGIGVAFTDWDEVFTGAASTMRDAYQDALNQLVDGGYDTQAVEWEFSGNEDEGDHDCAGDDLEECEHSYFVSIFVK